MQQTDAAGRLAAFTLLLAAALVLHVLWWHGVAVRSAWLPVVGAAVVAAARPASVGRLAVLLLAAAVAIVVELPALGSHLLLVLGVAVCVLVHVAARLVRGRRLPSATELGVVLVPFLRASVVVLYVAAVLSKLNHDYVDASSTPVAALTAKVLWFAPDALDGAGWRVQPAIWGSLLIELSLPLLLVARRTRTLGLVVGLAFHGVLALSGTVPFTTLMLALYVGFLPEGALRRGPAGSARAGARGAARASAGADRRGGPIGGVRRDVVAVVAIAGWLLVAGVGTVDPGRVTGGVLASATRIVVAGGALAAAVAVARWGRAGTAAGRRVVDAAGAPRPTRRGEGAGGRSRPSALVPARAPGALRGVFALGTVALVLVAASPYLGHRAGDAFTMYSGLRTAEGSWNHLVVPEAVRVRR